ncbi:MAG: 1-(5-phosphoribosyl)-5-[(5-phosphoribosylamino)methylideneamino]imidazole-4-carboxamide isomerase [Alphaproteobacteria bacterium]|nr:MAG: 1-(5-phosphoribosyl)-5-[(5-phosphoribosylamino)methylideneamino]imidazole-4-carboxamide isomerase [Alphaproteobacteria bacterium]
MILFPAIDLKDGRAVRLVRGEMASATVFNDDPAAQARSFAAAGFSWLHLVDLNGAFEGRPVNRAAVEAILAAVDIPVQLGGGIRDMATIEAWLAAGVRRVILGTAALEDPDLVNTAARRFPGRIVVGIDARDGRVAVRGWAEQSDIAAVDLARRYADVGVGALVYTDIERDGALQGVNVAATAALARAVPIPVIASGGVASLDDIAALMAVAEAGIEGVICGRALYDGRIDPSAALALVGSAARDGATGTPVRC